MMNALGNRPAVLRPERRSSEDQQIERALRKITR